MKKKNKVGVICTTMEEVMEVIKVMYPDDHSKVDKYISTAFLPVVVFESGSGSWNFFCYKPAITFKKWNTKYRQAYE